MRISFFQIADIASPGVEIFEGNTDCSWPGVSPTSHCATFLSAAMELEKLEDVIKQEIVNNRATLTVDASSELKEIPDSPEKFYIHLADYFDVIAGEQFS